MAYDHKKVEDVVMALLTLTTFNDNGTTKAWKGQDWDVLNALHDRGLIGNPKSKARSVVVTEEGEKTAKELFRKFFGGLPESTAAQRRAASAAETTAL